MGGSNRPDQMAGQRRLLEDHRNNHSPRVPVGLIPPASSTSVQGEEMAVVSKQSPIRYLAITTTEDDKFTLRVSSETAKGVCGIEVDRAQQLEGEAQRSASRREPPHLQRRTGERAASSAPRRWICA